MCNLDELSICCNHRFLQGTKGLWNTCYLSPPLPLSVQSPPLVPLHSRLNLCLVIVTQHVNVVVVLPPRLTAGDLSVQVNLNDYLDIYCPHYSAEGAQGPGQPETLALYLVGEASFRGCVETRGAIKRWECNTPHAAFGPVRFSEKIQRFTPFSLGFEFLPGRHYYYSCE